jgi:hypothetical protein
MLSNYEPKGTETMPNIVGTWRLVGAVSRDPDGRALPLPYGPQAIGRIVFTADKRVMVAICGGGRRFRPAPNANMAAIAAITHSSAQR